MCLHCIGSSQRHLKKKNACWQGFYNTIDRLLVSVLILYRLFSFCIICSHVFLNVREGSFISWKPTNGLQ
jgi:hypothetical protein